MSSPFPKSRKAIEELDANHRQGEGLIWRVGDALLGECGPPGPVGVNNGSSAKMQALDKELAAAGLKHYSLIWLRKVRDTAYAFTPDKRISAVKFWAHNAAGDPDTLAAVVKSAGDKPVTQKSVENYINQQRRKRTEAERQERDSLKDRAAPDIAREQAVNEYVEAFNEADELIGSAYDEIEPHQDRLTSAQRLRLEQARAVLYERLQSDPILGGSLREAAE